MGKVIKFPERKSLAQEQLDGILVQVDEILAQADRINEQTEALIAFMEKQDKDCE